MLGECMQTASLAEELLLVDCMWGWLKVHTVGEQAQEVRHAVVFAASIQEMEGSVVLSSQNCSAGCMDCNRTQLYVALEPQRLEELGIRLGCMVEALHYTLAEGDTGLLETLIVFGQNAEDCIGLVAWEATEKPWEKADIDAGTPRMPDSKEY